MIQLKLYILISSFLYILRVSFTFYQLIKSYRNKWKDAFLIISILLIFGIPGIIVSKLYEYGYIPFKLCFYISSVILVLMHISFLCLFIYLYKTAETPERRREILKGGLLYLSGIGIMAGGLAFVFLF